MKKYLLLPFAALSISFAVNAQEDKKEDKEVIAIEPSQKEADEDSYNKWSVEVDFGDAKGAKPYTKGYYGSDPTKFMGGAQLNHFGLGARYMLSPIFGIRGYVAYNDLENLKGNGSLPFQTQVVQICFEGVTNMWRLFEVQQKGGRFGLLGHFGIQASQITPKTGANEGKHELNGGIILGLTPQYRIFKNVSLFAEFSINSNIRQHLTWDGRYAEENENLVGSMYSASLGVSVALGKEKMHGDWAVISDKKSKEVEELNSRIGEIESLMNDSDKDGVPDYLDVENNSITGVAVDTKGRMVDMNGNGIPDQLEKYVDQSVATSATVNTTAAVENVVERLINEGYIAAYFDSGKSEPTIASSDNIGFILNYLKNNPNKSVQIIGYADEIGSAELNQKLTADRAENVKTILVKAGIDASRLNIVGNGIDKSVDKNSEYTRRLVRKVIFKITN